MIAGGDIASGVFMRIWPRLLGRKLQTDGVMALNLCNGSPNLSRERGWTCHSMLGEGWFGSLFEKAPNWDGGIVSGPVLNAIY